MSKTDYWDQIAPDYDNAYKSDWSKTEDSEIATILQNECQHIDDAMILDLGCGTGLGLSICANITNTKYYLGLDQSELMLQEAIKRSEISKFRHIKTRFLKDNAIIALRDFPNNTFDITLSLNASGSYIASTRILIQEAIRVTKPNGIIFLSFLNRSALRRLLLLRHSSIYEMNRSRGEFSTDSFAKAVTLSENDIFSRTPRASVTTKIFYQSVLGGVYENIGAIRFEKLLRNIIPKQGHTLNVILRKEIGA